MKSWEVEDTECERVKEVLADLLEKLDELDSDDFFGTEGWRNMLAMED